jgi:hypothetical protein
LLREGDVKHTGEPEEQGVRVGVACPLEVWREIGIDKWDPQYVEDFSAVGLKFVGERLLAIVPISIETYLGKI